MSLHRSSHPWLSTLAGRLAWPTQARSSRGITPYGSPPRPPALTKSWYGPLLRIRTRRVRSKSSRWSFNLLWGQWGSSRACCTMP